MAAQVFFLIAGEKPPKGAFVVPLPSNGDGTPSKTISFERVAEAVADASKQGHGVIYVECPPDA